MGATGMTNPIRRWWPALVVVVAATLALIGWQHVKRSYGSAFMDATWVAQPGTFRRGVVGRITGWNGRPEVGQQVQVEGNGKAAVAVTDDDGRFEVQVPGDASQLTVVGIDTIPLSRWNRPMDSLLTFDIRLKRPPPPSRGPL